MFVLLLLFRYGWLPQPCCKKVIIGIVYAAAYAVHIYIYMAKACPMPSDMPPHNTIMLHVTPRPPWPPWPPWSPWPRWPPRLCDQNKRVPRYALGVCRRHQNAVGFRLGGLARFWICRGYAAAHKTHALPKTFSLLRTFFVATAQD